MSAWTCHHSDGKADQKIAPPRSRTPCWKGLSADSEEKHEPASDIDTGGMDSLKALDPNRPIREADICDATSDVCFTPHSDHESGHPALSHSPSVSANKAVKRL